MSTISCPTLLQFHHLNFQSLQIKTFNTTVIWGQNLRQFQVDFYQNISVTMTTYEAGTRVAVHVKKEKTDEGGSCRSKPKIEIPEQRSETQNSAEDIEDFKGNANEKTKSTAKEVRNQERDRNEPNEEEKSFAQTNKFSIFNLLNSRKPGSTSSHTASVALAAAASAKGHGKGNRFGSAVDSASVPDCLPSTSRQLSTVPTLLKLKRSPSMHLLKNEDDNEEG